MSVRTFGSAVADVEVNPATGDISVVRVVVEAAEKVLKVVAAVAAVEVVVVEAANNKVVAWIE